MDGWIGLMCIATVMHLLKYYHLGDYVDLQNFLNLISVLFLKSDYGPSGKWRDRLYIKIHSSFNACCSSANSATKWHDVCGRQEDSAKVGIFVSL